jgi:RNA polymerase sigma-70 factor (ECF subfamily)
MIDRSKPNHTNHDGHTRGHWLRDAVDRFERPLLLYACRLIRDTDAARDAVQETFLRLCRQDPANVEPRLAEWLFAVCRNLVVDLRRKETRMSAANQILTDTPANSPPPPAEVETRDASSLALHLLDQLPPNQQEVLRLKFQQGLSYKQISAVTGLSVTNVGFLIHTGLKTLRRQMTPDTTLRT